MLRAEAIAATTQARDKTLIDEGEILIDRTLERDWQPGGEVSLTMPGQFSSRVVNHLADMYRTQGGWNVSVATSTYRETDGCLVLTFRKDSPTSANVQAYYGK